MMTEAPPLSLPFAPSCLPLPPWSDTDGFVCAVMGKPVPDRVKKRLRMETLLGLGWSVPIIAKDIGCSERTVTRWKQRFEQGDSEQDKPRSGRTRKLNPSMVKKLTKHLVRHRGRSTREGQKWLKGKGVDVTNKTVYNYMKRSDKYPRHTRKQPLLTEAQRTRRVAFARQYKDHDWMRTLMTDETEVALVQKPNSKNDIVWMPKGEAPPPAEVDPYAQTLRFWAGAFAKGRTKLHFFEGNLDGEGYRQILNDALPEFTKMLGSRRWTFQHDGAPAHKAKETNEWLRENVPKFIKSGPEGDWPAKSPDLNWIENIWSILDAKCSEGPRPRSLSALRERLKKAWANIPAQTFENCAKSMPKRLADVIRNKGEPLDV